MVFINKADVKVPFILTKDGVDKKNEHILEFTKDEAAYRDNSKHGKRFKFDRNIYADSTVKKTLETIQNNKCCFCESKYKHVAAGDVEHFRPKAAYRQGIKKKYPFVRPGYFWLAYDWENLLVSCENCNRRNKGNYFPIKNRISRCQDQTYDYNKEDPWFINPSKIDPENHISFYNETPQHLTFEGAQTIKFLQLDREELEEMRRHKLNFLLTLESGYLITIGSDFEEKMKENFFKHLREIISKNGEYHAMVKTKFKKYIPQL